MIHHNLIDDRISYSPKGELPKPKYRFNLFFLALACDGAFVHHNQQLNPFKEPTTNTEAKI